jgi:hypothetical protein
MNISAFKTAATLSIATGISLILFSFLGGKEDLFLLLNQDLGSVADFFLSIFYACWGWYFLGSISAIFYLI